MDPTPSESTTPGTQNAVTFDITEATLLSLWGDWFASASGAAERKVQRLRTTRKYLLIITAGLFGLYCGFRLWGIGDTIAGVLLSAIAFVTCYIALATLANRHVSPSPRRWLEAYRKSGHLDSMLGTVTYTALPEGLHAASRSGSGTHAWAAVRVTRRTENLVVVEYKQSAPGVLPLSAFASEQHAAAWVDLCETLRKAAPDTIPDPVAQHLRENDFKCLGCGYNLRDCTRGTCPECGWIIRIRP